MVTSAAHVPFQKPDLSLLLAETYSCKGKRDPPPKKKTVTLFPPPPGGVLWKIVLTAKCRQSGYTRSCQCPLYSSPFSSRAEMWKFMSSADQFLETNKGWGYLLLSVSYFLLISCGSQWNPENHSSHFASARSSPLIWDVVTH